MPNQRMRLRTLSQLLSWVSSLALLAGCAVGPNFRKPEAPAVNSYIPSPFSETAGATQVAGGESQRLLPSADIPAEWWTLFHSKPLNSLIERSLTNNPDLSAARAALVVAHENTLAQRGSYFPGITAGFSAARQKTSSELSPTPNSGDLHFSLFTPQVSVSYVPDVFGLNRRTVESLQAQENQARYALVAAHLSLSANVALAAIQEAALRGQLAATLKLIEINTNLLTVLRNQLAKGYVSQVEVAAQESQLAQVAASLPPLRKQLAQQRDLLAVLSGALPNQGLPEEFQLSALQLPTELPLSIPSQLVAQRPDVRQAEENLHAASAQIGIAVANRLPVFPLTADVGSMALTAGQIFAGGTGFWTLAAGVTQPIFQGGTLRHREFAARAAYKQATEQYRSAVLTAFQNVADTLNALEQDADALKAAARAEAAATVALRLARQQWQIGYSNYATLLNAEQTYQQATLNLIQTQAARSTDTVALFQALGGGWWNRGEFSQR